MPDCLMAHTKTCSRCGETKPVTEFYEDPRKEGRHRSVCKACWSDRKKAYCATRKAEIAEKDKLYYQTNKEKINQRIRTWKKENHQKLREQQRSRRETARELLVQLKIPCVKCGEDRPWVIHFHHIDPSEKEFEINTEAIMYQPDSRVKAEAGKCACLCANCHTEFHHFYGKNPSEPRSAFEKYIGGEENETVTGSPGDRMLFEDRLPLLDAGER